MTDQEINLELISIKRGILKAIFAMSLVLAGNIIIFVFYGWKLGVACLLLGWGNNIAIDGLYQKKTS
jgi:hypothetical protein